MFGQNGLDVRFANLGGKMESSLVFNDDYNNDEDEYVEFVHAFQRASLLRNGSM